MNGDPTQPLGDQKALGRTVVTLREDRNLTPETVAERAQMDVAKLKSVEAGEGDLDFNSAVFIFRAIGVPMGEAAALHERFVSEEEAEDGA